MHLTTNEARHLKALLFKDGPVRTINKNLIESLEREYFQNDSMVYLEQFPSKDTISEDKHIGLITRDRRLYSVIRQDSSDGIPEYWALYDYQDYDDNDITATDFPTYEELKEYWIELNK